MKIHFAVVIAGSYHWANIALRVFRRHFPEEILIVADYVRSVEHYFLKKHIDYCIYPQGIEVGGHQHGIAIDMILQQYPCDILVLLEPDCLYYDTGWYTNMLRAIESGYWMAGFLKLPWGPLHPCTTMWRTDKIQNTFSYVLKGTDVLDPYYSLLCDERLIPSWTVATMAKFHREWWDTSLKNWFNAARMERAALVPGGTLKHYWSGYDMLPRQKIGYL
jgi:hypothetical protein